MHTPTTGHRVRLPALISVDDTVLPNTYIHTGRPTHAYTHTYRQRARHAYRHTHMHIALLYKQPVMHTYSIGGQAGNQIDIHEHIHIHTHINGLACGHTYRRAGILT